MGGVEALPAGERLKHLRPQSEDLVAKMLDIRTPFNSDSGSANPLSGLPEAKLRKGGYTPLEKCLCQEWGHKGNRERETKRKSKEKMIQYRMVEWTEEPIKSDDLFWPKFGTTDHWTCQALNSYLSNKKPYNQEECNYAQGGGPTAAAPPRGLRRALRSDRGARGARPGNKAESEQQILQIRSGVDPTSPVGEALLKTQFVAKSWGDTREKLKKLDDWQDQGLQELLREAQKMRTAILQHRMVLDYLLAEEGGVCGKSNVSNCCLEIDDATKPRRSFGVLDESPVNSTRTSWLAKGRSGRARGTSSPASQKSRVAEDFFDRLPAEGVEAAEGSSASGGEPQGLLQSLKGLDDLEADLLGASRPGSGPGKTTVKEPPAAQTPLCTATPVWKRKELTFEEDSDDLMAALGLGSGPGRAGRQGKKAEEEEVRPARAKLDEFLGRGSMTRTLEEPDLGERREVKLAKEYQKQLEKEEGRHKDDFVFGAYQPTVASIAKGRPARRQPLRFSAEKNSELKAEPLSKAPLSASQSPAWGCRNRSGWLGLKREEFFDLELSSPAKASPAGSSRSPAAAGQPGPARQLLAAEEAAAKTDPVEEEEDWLSAALARKKAQAQAKAQERTAKPSEVPGEGLNPGSPVSPPAASPGAQPQAAAVPDKAASTRSSR
ncbi:fas-binding factor 1 homolog [Strix uralensis]|uniref:fas-binding factor 1 homolog n=1 Tax=Strix uralensis TaxID=36305 RepID=UPI003DA7233F